jgi:hypothetical protein
MTHHLRDYVVSKMDELLKSFNDDFQAKLRLEWTGLVAQEPVVCLKWTGAAPSASAVTSMLSTGPTGTGDTNQFAVPPKK